MSQAFSSRSARVSPILLAPQALLAELQAQQADAAMLDNGPETDYKQTFRP